MSTFFRINLLILSTNFRTRQAGVVSLFSHVPSEADGRIRGKYTTEYQTNNNLIGNGWMLERATNHWVMALRGSFRIAKNYRNKVDGRVYNTGFQETNASGLIGYQGAKGYIHFNATQYNNLQGIPDGSRDSLIRKFTKQTSEGPADSIKNRQLVTDPELNSYALSPLHQRIQHYRLYINAQYKAAHGVFLVSLAWQQSLRQEFNHPTKATQAGLDVRLNTLSGGVRYSVSPWGNWQLSMGGNAMQQTNKSMQATDFPIPNFTLGDAGIFSYLTWAGGPWHLSAGLRSDVRVVNLSDLFIAKDFASGFEHQVGPTEGTQQPYHSFSKWFSGLSASAGATYKIDKNLSLKANIGRGYRAPSVAELSANGLDPGAHIRYLGDKSLLPEFSLQEDLGLLFGSNQVSCSLSMFHNSIQNFIYLDRVVDATGVPISDAQGNRSYQNRAGSARLYGLEGTMTLQPTALPNWTFTGAGSLLHGNNTDPRYRGKGNEGSRLPNILPPSLQASMSYSWSWSRIEILPTAGLNWVGNQNRYLALNMAETRTPGYMLLDLGLGANFPTGHAGTMLLQVQVNNVLDRVYQSNLSRLKYFEYYANSPNARYGIYGQGLNVCLKAIFKFI